MSLPPSRLRRDRHAGPRPSLGLALALSLSTAAVFGRATHAQSPSAPPACPTPAAAPPARTDDAPPESIRISRRWAETRDPSIRLETADERSREQLGRLVHSRLDLEVDGAPLRDVLRALRTSLGINLVVFELDPTGRSKRGGIDADVRVSMSVADVDGRTALATLLGFAGGEPTWQLRDGVVEVGPKEVLARSDARRTAIYDVTDLSLDPPDFDPKNPFASRDSLDVEVGEILRMVSTHCEPKAYEPAGASAASEPEGTTGPVQHVSPGGRAGTGPNTAATRNFDPEAGPLFVRGRWATIQVKQKNLVVHAPDFVHRAIDGYPTPIPPPRTPE